MKLYDDDMSTINLSTSANSVLDFLLSNTDERISELIKLNVKDNFPCLVVNQITGNKVQPFFTKVVTLKTGNLIKTFESFRYRF